MTHLPKGDVDPDTRALAKGVSSTVMLSRTSASLSLRSLLASASASGRPRSGRRESVMVGVLHCMAAVIKISRRRGIPSVTFASPRPAMWNLRGVTCAAVRSGAIGLTAGRRSSLPQPAPQPPAGTGGTDVHSRVEGHLRRGFAEGLPRDHPHGFPGVGQSEEVLELHELDKVVRSCTAGECSRSERGLCGGEDEREERKKGSDGNEVRGGNGTREGVMAIK